ncbi:DUF2793 domain-containing protein [Qipengyuania thermophila]|uniref:DUF2793 domain-containing protein n=1 Tax=Qipengyuania thermophila TaxID=2509361 RepID=UPI0013ECFFDC|nr:DUF2793 domain-containing protein [Qipengyuania thermophila]
MPPTPFRSVTSRASLPLLHPGQAQKEFILNESLARIDALLHPGVAGVAASLPQDPASGECWLVAEDAAGPLAAEAGAIAAFDGAQWTFCKPVPGMTVLDRGAGCIRMFTDRWSTPAELAAPAGGSVVDGEARAAIVAIMQALASLSLVKHR